MDNSIQDHIDLMSPPGWFTVIPLLLAFVSQVGCSPENDGRMPVYPVTGKVTVGGQPAAGAEVVFYGATPDLKGPGTVPPEGTTDANGVYQLSTFETDDGSPAGQFKVTIFWPEPIPPDVDQEMYQPKDRLKERFLNPETSGLTAKVPKGGGVLPTFELN